MALDIESFGYSVLTMVIGMTIVFVSLGALSILMYILRASLDRQGAPVQSNSASVDNEQQTEDASSAQQQGGGDSAPLLREVILAATIAHLQYEERERQSASYAWSGASERAHTKAGGWLA